MGVPSLSGLDVLSSVGALVIQSNPALTNVDGLNALTEIAGDASFDDNTGLESIDGLENLIHVGQSKADGSYGTLEITGNPKLPQCAVEALFWQLLESNPNGLQFSAGRNDTNAMCE